MNIYFEVENYNREMESRILLAMDAASNGHQVYISDRTQILENAKKKNLEPGIIFMKDVNSQNYMQENLKIIKKNGFYIIATDEEAGIQFENYENFIKARSIRTFENIDLYICWGLRDKNILKKKFNKNKVKFLILGSPRIDLCKPFILEKKKFRSLKKINNQKYILVASNVSFPIGNRELPDYISERVADDKLDADWREKFLYFKYTNHTQILFFLVSLIRKMAREFPERVIVVRPHPNERVISWEKILIEKFNNIKIIKSGGIADYIYNSEILVHSGCTSGIESYMMKRKSISYLPINLNNSYDRKISDDVSIFCKKEEEVINQIKKDDKYSYSESPDLKNRVININHTKSFKKINSAFNIIGNYWKFKSSNNDSTFIQNNKLSQVIKGRIKNKIKHLLGIKSQHVFFEKFPPIEKNEIFEMFNELKNIDKSYSDTKLQILNDHAIKIFKK